MKHTKRKPVHPGIIIDEHYIKPLHLNLQELADNLHITRNTLFKIRKGKARITPAIAIALSKAFDTTPELWLHLQQKYDLWVEENKKSRRRVVIVPIFREGVVLPKHMEHRRRATA
jgi:addiction module HigA family antidote